jgi:hypothetical protein
MFLAGKLLEAVQRDIETGFIEDDGHYNSEWAKREVVSHCIYGVDLNDLAVELAKVSLWLATISKDKPLSFLDHRLKQGNSLKGAHLKDLPWHPKRQDRRQKRLDIPEGFIAKLVDTVGEISSLDDDSLSNIRKKEEIFERFKTKKEYDMIRTLADVRTSIFFGNVIDERAYGRYSGDAYESSDEEWRERRERSFARSARSTALNNGFFHWELEFPEVFFEKGRVKSKPGFDVVIGNPPYIHQRGEKDEPLIPYVDRDFFRAVFRCLDTSQTTTRGGIKINAFMLFVEKSLDLLKENGYFGNVLHKNIIKVESYKLLRKNILNETSVESIIDLASAFEDVTGEMCILTLRKTTDRNIISENVVDVEFWDTVSEDHGTRRNQIPQNIFSTQLDSMFPLFMTPELIRIRDRILSVSEPLGDLANVVCFGLNLPARYIHSQDILGTCEKAVRGKDIGRYAVNNIRYVEYNPKYLSRKGDLDSFRADEKILVQRVGGSLTACYDDQGLFTFNTVNMVLPKKGRDAKFILAHLNSKLLDNYFKLFFILKSSYTVSVTQAYLEEIPIRKVSSATPHSQRVDLLMKLSESYKDYLSEGKKEPLLRLIEDCLPKDSKGNFILWKDRSDVVHDFLSQLAGEMTDIEIAKREEISMFLEWLEREIGTEVEMMTGKTKLKQYFTIGFEGLLHILKRNRGRIEANLSSRILQETLREEYDRSVSLLSPLVRKSEVTDEIINSIVYRLYGLDRDDIMIIEESMH